jgi:hypothetical protein
MPHSKPKQWDPDTVLSIINPDYKSITCVGYAPSCRRRCRNPINAQNRARAADILHHMSVSDPDVVKSDKTIYLLAESLLCVRYHKDQVDAVVKQWRHQIKKRCMIQPTLEAREKCEHLKDQIRDLKIELEKQAAFKTKCESEKVAIYNRWLVDCCEKEILRKQVAHLQQAEARSNDAVMREIKRRKELEHEVKMLQDVAERPAKDQHAIRDQEMCRQTQIEEELLALRHPGDDMSSNEESDEKEPDTELASDTDRDSETDNDYDIDNALEIDRDSATDQDPASDEDSRTDENSEPDDDKEVYLATAEGSLVERKAQRHYKKETMNFQSAHIEPIKYSRWSDHRHPELLPLYSTWFAFACVVIMFEVRIGSF